MNDTLTLTLPIDEIATTLACGDEWWNADETIGFRASVETDEWSSGFDEINGCDCYGRVAWVQPRRDSYRNCFSGPRDHATRPVGFTGAAVKMTTHAGDSYWWEPYREGAKVYATAQDREIVADLMNYGPSVVVVRRLERLTASTGTSHVVEVDSTSLSGLEPFPASDVVQDVIGNLLYDMIS